MNKQTPENNVNKLIAKQPVRMLKLPLIVEKYLIRFYLALYGHFYNIIHYNNLHSFQSLPVFVICFIENHCETIEQVIAVIDQEYDDPYVISQNYVTNDKPN